MKIGLIVLFIVASANYCLVQYSGGCLFREGMFRAGPSEIFQSICLPLDPKIYFALFSISTMPLIVLEESSPSIYKWVNSLSDTTQMITSSLAWGVLALLLFILVSHVKRKNKARAGEVLHSEK